MNEEPEETSAIKPEQEKIPRDKLVEWLKDFILNLQKLAPDVAVLEEKDILVKIKSTKSSLLQMVYGLQDFRQVFEDMRVGTLADRGRSRPKKIKVSNLPEHIRRPKPKEEKQEEKSE